MKITGIIFFCMVAFASLTTKAEAYIYCIKEPNVNMFLHFDYAASTGAIIGMATSDLAGAVIGSGGPIAGYVQGTFGVLSIAYANGNTRAYGGNILTLSGHTTGVRSTGPVYDSRPFSFVMC